MYRRVVFPLLRRIDAEWAHERTLAGLSWLSGRPLLLGLLRHRLLMDDQALHVRLWGCEFPNPVGVAAGLDKNGVVASALHGLGFGHVEVGTVTPEPQAGNPQPRMFRLPEDQAVINRLGFPGVGGAEVAANLARLPIPRPVLGVNLGANKTQVAAGLEAAAADYCAGLTRFAALADYLVINISSPNTAQLRALQGRESLDALLGVVMAHKLAVAPRRPLLVKIAPDLSPAELDDVLAVVTAHRVDGLIASNTTTARPAGLRGKARNQAGGLSGQPLGARSTAIIRSIYRDTAGRLPIIGVGGVLGAADVWEKLAAGASLVQLYTGFVYGGPLLAATINRTLRERMRTEGLCQVGEIVGTAA